MSRKIKAAVIGLGRIGKIHANNIANYLTNAELVAVADPLLDKAYAKTLGVRKVYTDPQLIFKDPAIEAVIICTPTDTHADFIKKAALAKKAVFCEKPVSHDLKTIDQVIAVVKKAHVPVQIGFNRRFDPNFKAAKEKILAGKIGKTRMIKVISNDPAPPPASYIKHSGGLFFDMTIHDFDMVRFLAGENVVKVYAEGANLVDAKIKALGDIDTAIITLTLKSGAIASITNCRQSAYGYDQRIEVFGDKGSIKAENVYPNTTVLSTKFGIQTEKPLYFFLERYEKAYRDELNQFFNALIQKKSPSVGLIDIKNALLIAKAAKQSLKTKKPVTIKKF